mgnify:CR=1 FL=1
MRQTYHKLVRDRIPEIIRKQGKTCEVVILSEHEYRQALLQKLREEAEEVATASPGHLLTELADLYEVLDALMVSYKIDPNALLLEQDQRRAQRGGFEERVQLVWVDDCSS